MVIYHSDVPLKKQKTPTEQISKMTNFAIERDGTTVHLHNVTWSNESSRSLMLPQGASDFFRWDRCLADNEKAWLEHVYNYDDF